MTTKQSAPWKLSRNGWVIGSRKKGPFGLTNQGGHGRLKTKMCTNYTTLGEWNQLPLHKQQELLRTPGDGRPLNPTRKTIGWADVSLNIITGCLHECPYCYAAKIAARKLSDHPPFDQPAIWPARLERLSQNLGQVSGKRIFWGSAADIFGDWVPAAWLKAIADAIIACDAELEKRDKKLPTHIFLTKNPYRYNSPELRDLWAKPNVWFGATVDTQVRWNESYDALKELAHQNYSPRHSQFDSVPNIWLSMEPLLTAIDFGDFGWFIKQIVIGAQTGAGAKPPERQWVEAILKKATFNPTPIGVWIKDSLGYHQEVKYWYNLDDYGNVVISTENKEAHDET